MNREVVDIFRETEKKMFIDCTLGMGGHSYLLLKHFKNSRIIGLDVDCESLAEARKNLSQYDRRVQTFQMNFIHLFNNKKIHVGEASGMLIDPGISIFQLQKKERGFSFNVDAPLDMRKDKASPLTAAQVVNQYNEEKLSQIFESYGEIRRAPALAKKIIEARLFGPIKTTSHLKEIIEKMYGWRPQRGKTHPASQVFQALRIFVNRELEGIEIFLEKAVATLKKGARIIFLSFHSLEDRIVKRAFIQFKKQKLVEILKPFPAFPSAEEIKENLASRSAKLRALEIL